MAMRPTTTATFLLTDIAASTRLRGFAESIQG